MARTQAALKAGKRRRDDAPRDTLPTLHA